MLRRDAARAALLVCLGIWIFSLFLPAFDTYYWSETHHVSGFGAIGYSLMLGAGAVAMLAMATPKNGATLVAIPVYLLAGEHCDGGGAVLSCTHGAWEGERRNRARAVVVFLL